MATAPFVVIPELTAIAIAFRNPDAAYIADQVMPRVQPVGTKTFRYQRYGLEAFGRPDTRVGRKGRPNEVIWGSRELEASVEDWGLEDPLPQDDLDQAAKMHQDISGQSVEYIMGLIRLDRECRVAAMVQDPAGYEAANTLALSGSDQFSDPASDPVRVLNESLDAPLVRPNTVVMSQPVWARVRVHPKAVQAIYPGAQGGMVTREQFAALLEVDRLLVGNARVNVNRKGQDPSLVRTWGPHISLLYLDPTASTRQGVTWGMTVPYGKPVAGAIADPNIGLRGGVRVRAGESLKELVTAPEAGFLLRNVIA